MIVNARSIKRVRQMIEISSPLEEVQAELEKMLAIKRKMRSYNDYYPCCSGSQGYICISLEGEIEILKAVLSTLEHNETAQAVDLLKQYEHIAGVKYR